MKNVKRLALITSMFAGTTANVLAGPYGYDLHNVLAPRSAGIAGTSIAEPLDNVSAVFGNPATLSQFTGTEFTFGATWYKPEVEITHDGSVTGQAFSAKNGNEGYLVPQVAVTQDLRGLGLPATLGAGLTAVSGIGVEVRANDASLGAGAEFIIFGANLGLGYELSDRWSIGGALTMSFAQMDLGLAGTSQETHDVSWRGSLGTWFKASENTKIGFMYHSELKHNFSDIILASHDPDAGVLGVTTGSFQSLEIDQPMNLGLGISNRSLMGGNLYLAADVMWKNWKNTEFWGDVYDDQFVFSLGGELTHGSWKFRGGYGYAEDPTKDIQGLSQLDAVCAGVPAACFNIPVVKPVAEYLQAVEAEVIYKHRITAGVGYTGFLAPFLDLDLHVGYQIKEDRDYGGHTQAEVYSWHTGFALTWHFE